MLKVFLKKHKKHFSGKYWQWVHTVNILMCLEKYKESCSISNIYIYIYDKNKKKKAHSTVYVANMIKIYLK